jgi:hypothetical protein
MCACAQDFLEEGRMMVMGAQGFSLDEHMHLPNPGPRNGDPIKGLFHFTGA